MVARRIVDAIAALLGIAAVTALVSAAGGDTPTPPTTTTTTTTRGWHGTTTSLHW